MSALRTIRRLHRRHPVALRGALLLLLAVVTFASMPKWLVHSHAGAHETLSLFTDDAPAEHYHDAADVEDVADVTLPDVPHRHVHYLAGTAATLPSMWLDLFHPVFQREGCPVWSGESAPDSPRVPLYRPPIA